MGTTIFTVMSALAVEHGAVNLGQGFPDEDGPRTIRDAAAKALIEGPNQYPPTRGRIELRRAIAAHAKRFYGSVVRSRREGVGYVGWNRSIDGIDHGSGRPRRRDRADRAGIRFLWADGDRVRRDRENCKAFAAGLAADSEAALAAAFTPKTRALVLNTPLNPIGRVFDAQERAAIANVLRGSRAVAICDEVYEHLVFDGRPHVPLITLPGMADRVVRVGSAGKMFSLTGWKIGWVTGAAQLIDVIAKAHQFLTFTTSPALQLGIAHGLEHEIDFTLGLTKELQAKRDLLEQGLSKLGFNALACEGTYFLTADIRGLTNEPDRVFCERLVREGGVALIPLSAFFDDGTPDHLVRFAFCKKREVIEDALARLERFSTKRQDAT